MSRIRLSISLISLLFLAGLISLPGNAQQVQDVVSSGTLVKGPIDNRSLSVIPGTVHSLPQSAIDLGTVPASLPADRMLLTLRRSQARQTLLEVYLQSLQDRNSPNFRRYLTPEEFGEKFGPGDSDIAALTAWLRSERFSVDKVSKGRLAIEFSGTLGDLQRAFHTEIHTFLVDGERHYASISDIRVPAALAPAIAGVSAMNDLRPRSAAVSVSRANWNPSLHRFVPQATLSNNGISYLYVGPGDAATIYDSPNGNNAKLKAGQAIYNGSGVVIGIVGLTTFNTNDVANYRTFFALPASLPNIIVDGNNSSFLNPAITSATVEALLDVEVAGAIAPGASINYYTAADTTLQPGVLLAIFRAIDDNAVNILDVGFGSCETIQGATGNQQVLNLWEQAAAQGIAVVVPTGDSGSAGCDDPNYEALAKQGLAVNAFASTPYNIAVGGTDFDILSSKFSSYVGTAESQNTTTALSYITENPWNDSTTSLGPLADNIASTGNGGKTNILAGGGGMSSAAIYDTSGVAVGGYTQPLWQQAFNSANGIASTSARAIPDISLFAGDGEHNAVWALCGDYDCVGSTPTLGGVGGTSASAAAFAGVLALVNQKVGSTTRLGQPASALYHVAETTPGAFHSVTVGNNSVPCAGGSPDCAANQFLPGYDTSQLRYNMASGLGSIDIATLVNAWSDAALTPTAPTLSLSPTTFTHGDTVNIGVEMNPSSASGIVAIVTDADSQAGAIASDSQGTLTLQNGASSGIYNQFPGGTYDVFASYGGDIGHAAGVSAPVRITVAKESSVLILAGIAVVNNHETALSGASVPFGSFLALDAAPGSEAATAKQQPSGLGTGSVTFFDTLQNMNFNNILINSKGFAEVTTYMPAGKHSISATYSGDNSYEASSASPISFSITKASTAVTLTKAAASSDGSTNLVASVTPNPASAYVIVSGTVRITDTTTGTVLGTPSVSETTDAATGLTVASASLDIAPGKLAAGDNSIAAVYSGDSNYSASPASPAITVTCATGCNQGSAESIAIAFGTPTPSSRTLSPGGTLTGSVIATPGGGFTGSVAITCSVAGTLTTDTKIPSCTLSPTTIDVVSAAAVSAALTVTTTAATTADLERPTGFGWEGCTAVLACLLLFPASAVRRKWKLMIVLSVVAAVGVTACGGGSAQSGGKGTPIPGTSADTYTITVNATDASTGKITAKNSFTIQVQ